MAIAIADLLKPLDKRAVLADLYGFAQALGLTTSAWQPGEPVPVVLDVIVSWAVDKLWNPVVVPALQGPFLDYSRGKWLSLEAWARYFRPRIETVYATGSLVVENHAGFTGTIAVGQMRVKSTPSGKTYTNTSAAPIAAWPGGMAAYPSVTLTWKADEAGSASSAQPGDIATTPVVAPDPNLFVLTNASAFLGSDEEPDDRVVTRCRDAAAELSSTPPRAAFEGVALDPLGAFTRRALPIPPSWGTVAPAITRVRVVDTGNATATVYLASDTGPAAAGDVTKAAVALRLLCNAVGVSLTVVAATEKDVAVGTITLYIDAAANVTAADAIAGAQQALAFFFSRLSIGGTRKTNGGPGYLFSEEVQRAAGTWPQALPDGSGGVYYPKIPGLVAVVLTLTDTALAAGEVVVPTYSVAANIVDQA